MFEWKMFTKDLLHSGDLFNALANYASISWSFYLENLSCARLSDTKRDHLVTVMLPDKGFHTVAVFEMITSKCLSKVTASLRQTDTIEREYRISWLPSWKKSLGSQTARMSERYVFTVSHTPVSRFSHTAIFKRVNKALYYSAEERARKSTGTLPTCHSVCGKPDKQEQASVYSCRVTYLFINPAPTSKWFTEHFLGLSQDVIKRPSCLSGYWAVLDKLFIWLHFHIVLSVNKYSCAFLFKHNTEFMTLKRL